MSILEILLIAVGMAMDAFAVCLGVGTVQKAAGPRRTFRLAWHFGLFQFFMPVLGWFAGRSILRYIAPYDTWLAFGLLAFVGVRMIQSSRGPAELSRQGDADAKAIIDAFAKRGVTFVPPRAQPPR